MPFLEWLVHLLVPRSSNNHRPRLLHQLPLSILVIFLLISQGLLIIYTRISPSVLGYASNINPQTIIDLTNQKRAANGLPPLTANSTLNEVAQRKASDMFAQNYWAHVSPTGKTPWTFFQELGYRYTYAGENLARDFMDSGTVVEAWMNSPSHRKNILDDNYKEIGLAVVNGSLEGTETTLVVQVFGTPTPVPAAKAPVEKKTVVTEVKQVVEQVVQSQIQPELGESDKTSNYYFQPVESKTIIPSLFSPFMLTKTLTIFILGLILGALLVDAILVHQRRIVRLSGRSLAHLIFIGFLLLAVIWASPGVIL